MGRDREDADKNVMSHEKESIVHPHAHDVLSGRGNFVNYHAGNEHFRGLVRKYKVEYVKCPKREKGKFARMIYNEIKELNPPGRYLKRDGNDKPWYDIGEKKALDKTRQALREGAPELAKEMAREGEQEQDSDSNDDPVPASDAAANDVSAEEASMAFESPEIARRSLKLQLQMMSPERQPAISSNPMAGMSPDMELLSSRMGIDAGGNFKAEGAGGGMQPLRVYGSQDFMIHQQQQLQRMMFGVGDVNTFRTVGPLQQHNNCRVPLPLVPSNGSGTALEHQQQQSTSQLGRIPPPLMLEREDSLKGSDVFNLACSPGDKTSKKKYGEQVSADQMSAMSLSLGDINDDEGNLSSVFDSSLRITKNKVATPSNSPVVTGRKRTKDVGNKSSSRTFEGDIPVRLDMSVATIGTTSKMSEAGNMSCATFDSERSPILGESQGQMSFTNVFE